MAGALDEADDPGIAAYLHCPEGEEQEAVVPSAPFRERDSTNCESRALTCWGWSVLELWPAFSSHTRGRPECLCQALL